MTRLIVTLLLSTALISCSSDDASVNSEHEETNFFGLEIGNKWEYHYYQKQVSSEDQEFVFNGTTSTHEVIGITEIDNIDFFEIEINTEGRCAGCPPEGLSQQYLRVEDEQLIDEDGVIQYFIGNSVGEEYLRQTFEDVMDVMIVYSGENQFESDYGIYTNTHKNLIYGIFTNTDEPTPGNEIIHFVEGIGMVYKTHTGAGSANPSTKQYLVELTSNPQ